MEDIEIEMLDKLEDSHWWYQIRREIISTWAKNLPLKSTVLDIGSATGGNTILLTNLGFSVSSLELSRVGIEKQKAKGISVIAGDARSLPFQEGVFDAIVCLDVLEHIKDDAQVLAEGFRVLKPGGQFLFSVPEDPKLWSSHDEAVSHIRRYMRVEFKEKILSAGFVITRIWSSNVILRPLIQFARKFTSGSNAKPVHPIFNFLFLTICKFEKLLNIREMKGVTIWSQGYKPQDESLEDLGFRI